MSGEDNPSDIFTKNLQGPSFNKHASKYVGHDEYMDALDDDDDDTVTNKPTKPPWKLVKYGKTKAKVQFVNDKDNNRI